MVEIVKGLLVRKGHVLMARRSASRPHYPNTWSFPGGHVEDRETVEQALARELREEIGVEVKSWSYLQSFDDRSTRSDNVVRFHFFVVDSWGGNPTNIGDEHSEIRWIEPANAREMQDLAFTRYGELFDAIASA